jgi:GNAT superfamily N-acetyltransferase
MEVVSLTAADCLDLRRQVLRTGTPSTDPRFAEDDWPDTFHLGARDEGGALLAIVTFVSRGNEAQLRGMATAPSVQRTGAGRVLFEAGVARLRDDGVRVLWAKARDSALGFYERMGMHVEGDGYVTEETGMPHHTVVMDL